MAEGRVHLDCRNASNPYHECVEFCFLKIAESKERMEQLESDVKQGRTTDGPARPDYPNQAEDHRVQESGREGLDNGDDDDHPVEENLEVDYSQLTGWRKRLFELNMKMNEARKANQTAMVAEKKRSEAPTESRGICKQKWIDERTNKNGKLLDANGLDMKKACMLDTQEVAEKKYKKWEKKPAPSGRDDVKQGRTTDSPASSDYSYQSEDQHVQESGREEHGNGDELYGVMTDVKQGRTTDSPASSDYPYQAKDQHVQESGREEHGNGGELYGVMTDGRVHLNCRNTSNPYHECVEFCFLKIAESKERMEQPESVSDQKTLYDAHKKRTKNIECNVREYNKMKEADPEFYHEASGLQYEKAPEILEADPEFYHEASDLQYEKAPEILEADPEFYREASGLQYEKAPEILEDGFYKMMKERQDKDEKRKAFSKRRTFPEEKDIDSINDRNENSNKILEISFGKYTLEIKNNLATGTALQGCVGAGLFTACISVAALNCIWVSSR